MNAKTQADPIRPQSAGIDAAPRRSSYSNHVHHRGQPITKKPQESAKAIAALKAAPEVGSGVFKAEATKLFRLHKDRIGDIFAIARKNRSFGDLTL